MPDAFLSAAGWSGASRTPIAGDASGRAYERLRLGGSTAILMRAPHGSGAEIERFVLLADHLRSLGLSAPRVFAVDSDSGHMLLEDLGDSLYPATIAANPALEPTLYRAAIDCLFILQAAPPPVGPTTFTADEMAAQAALAHSAWAGAPDGAPCPFEAPLRAALEALPPPRVLMLRDFHADNLFWLPDRPGVAAVGLIDFQDARLSVPLYDIVSLLWDARRDIPGTLRQDLLAHAAAHFGRPLADVAAEAATLSLQRNLRILGVFARLGVEAGKPGYLAHVPRVWKHIESALAAPHLHDLAEAVRDSLPPPSDAHLARLEARCQPTTAP